MVKRVVVDSSVMVKWLNTTDEEYIEQSDKLLADALEEKIQLLAPELAKYEVSNVLLFSKKLPPWDLEIPLHTLFVSPVQFITESEDSVKEAYTLAFDLGITFYDAVFMSLAKQYNAVLVTDNVKHQGKAPEIKVLPLKDYFG